MQQFMKKAGHWIGVFVLNLYVSYLLITAYQWGAFQFQIQPVIEWLHLHTKLYALIGLVISIIFLSLYKYQVKLYYFLLRYPLLLKTLKVLMIILVFLCFAIVLNFLFQLSHLINEDAAVNWIQDNPELFIAGTLYVFLFGLAIYMIVGNIYVAATLYLITGSILAYIHYNKMNFRSEPLYPADFKQVGHMKEVLPMVTGYFSIGKIITLLILIALFSIIVPYLPKLKVVWWARLALLPLLIALIYSATFYESTYMKAAVEKIKMEAVAWNQLRNFEKNGFVFGFLSNLQGDQFKEPDSYTKSKVVNIAEDLQKSSAVEVFNSNPNVEEKPNIIFLMSEAFWDPTRLPGVEFSEDPMPFIRKVMKDYPSGDILSPMFGGGTANVEFEALTGFSISYLKEGTIPYQDMVENQNAFPTIVSTLKERDYYALAYHPFNKIFYKRNRVYDKFGFDEFISRENATFNDYSGRYISDESVTDEIIKTLEDYEQPTFMHAVTMQNHFPYRGDRYENPEIQVSGLPEDQVPVLEEYVEGIRRTDIATKRLVENLEKLDEPTMVVFWGDHLPILGDNKALYDETGFAKGKNLVQEDVKYSETPMFIYTNYPVQQKDLGTVSPVFLPSLALNYAGFELPPFYSFLAKLKQEVSGIKAIAKVDAEGNVIRDLTENQKKLLHQYELLEYDLLSGKQYSESVLFNQSE